LLPGHGAGGKDFIKSGPLDWQAHVLNDIDYHFQNNEEIFLIGHSLGGLLALQAATQFNIAGIVLINTAMRTRMSLQQMMLSLKVLFTSKNSNDPIVSSYRNSFGVGLHDWWTLPAWSLKLLDVLKVAKQTKKLLSQVKTRIHIFQSIDDETVHPKSAELLKRGLNNSTVQVTYLQNSMHAYFDPEDLQLITEGIKELVNHRVVKSS
jgi:carboxylesterase